MSGLPMRLRRTWQSGFLRSVAALMGGNAVATAVPVLAAPVLGRLYAPADYGALAQYMAPAAVLAVLASLQFQHAIIAEKSDRGAGRAAWLVILSSIMMGGLTALAVSALWPVLFAGTAAGLWFAALPVSVAAAGVIAAGQFLANRMRRYRFIAAVQMTHVLATVAVSMALGVLGWGANGLLAAYFAGQLLQLCLWGWALRSRTARLDPWPGFARLRTVMRRHWKFPAFTLPSEFSGQINMQAPVFALSALGAEAVLGAFTRARQLVSMPATVAGGAVAQVFRRDAAELYHRTGSCRGLMLRTAGGLFAAGLVPCLIFMAFAPWLFEVYLGPAWREAGEIARILAPMLLLQVVVSPISTIFYIANRQGEDFVLNLASTLLMLGTLTMAIVMEKAQLVLVFYSAVLSVVYLVYFGRSIFLAKGQCRDT